jgi:hypothetical protein
MPRHQEFEPAQAQGMTEWYNPLDTPWNVDIRTGPSVFVKSTGKRHPGLVRYTLQPKGRALIPAEYDSAIHHMHPDGQTIMGGLGPRLVKVDEKDRKLHPSLDPAATKRKEADDKKLAAEEREREAKEREERANAELAAAEAETRALEIESKVAAQRAKLVADKAKAEDEARAKLETAAGPAAATGEGGSGGSAEAGEGKGGKGARGGKAST